MPRSNIPVPAPPDGYVQSFFESWNKPGLNAGAWYSWSGNPGSSPTTTTWDPAMLSTGNGLVIAAEPDTTTPGKTRTGGVGRTHALVAPYMIQVACQRPTIANLKRNAGIAWPNSGSWPVDVEIDYAEDGGGPGFDLNYHSNVPSYNSVDSDHSSNYPVAVDTSVWGVFTFTNAGTVVSTTWTPISGQPVTLKVTPKYLSPKPHNLDMQIEALASNLLSSPVQFNFDWYQESFVPGSGSGGGGTTPPPSSYFGAVYTKNAKGIYVVAGYEDVPRPGGASWHPLG